MAVLFLQCFVALLVLGFALLSAGVVREEYRAYAGLNAEWMLTSLCFGLVGLSMVAQSSLAVWAYYSGPNTAIYEGYIRWSPAVNYGRLFVEIAFASALLFLEWRRRNRGMPFWTSVGIVFGLAAFGGVVLGWREGLVISGVHYLELSTLNSFLLVLMSGALLVGAARGAMDRLLWLALTIFTLHHALAVFGYAALSQIAVEGAWTPSPLFVWVQAAVSTTAMVVVAGYRLILSHRRVFVPALIETSSGPKSLMGWK